MPKRPPLPLRKSVNRKRKYLLRKRLRLLRSSRSRKSAD